MSGPDFDWSGPDVIVQAQARLAAYLNEDHDVVLRQDDWPHSDTDSCIIIARANVETVINALSALIGEKPSRPVTSAALRQKRYRERHARNGLGVTGDGEFALEAAGE